VATDLLGQQQSASFTVVVNETEVSGVVEFDNFAGTSRNVTFQTGGNGSGSFSSTNLNLGFISGPILSAGAYQNVASLAGKINTPTDSVSVWLRNGQILNLSTLVNEIMNKIGGVSAYINTNEFGYITYLPTLASQLATQQRPIDVYIYGRLSPSTQVALANYVVSPTPFNGSVLTKALLLDFTNIALGPSIYDPVRFAGITINCSLTGTTVQINRCLLVSAYTTYVAGTLNALTAQQMGLYNPSVPNPALAANILADFATLTYTASLWPTPITMPYDQGLYNQQLFLGVTLSPLTSTLLQNGGVYPITDPLKLVLLNQSCLQDAFAGLYQKPPLTPATLAAATGYPATAQAFVTGMTTDLNALINSGGSIYSTNTFASFTGAISANAELMALLLTPTPPGLTPDQQIRENRLLLETAYNTELSKSILANYRLVQVPTGAALVGAQVSAKTAWSLRVRQTTDLSSGSATVNFITDGTPGWNPATDTYLRSGDVTGDNTVNLFDYNVLRTYWPPQGYNTQADIDGNGVINGNDYSLMQGNWGKSGDDAVSH